MPALDFELEGDAGAIRDAGADFVDQILCQDNFLQMLVGASAPTSIWRKLS